MNEKIIKAFNEAIRMYEIRTYEPELKANVIEYYPEKAKIASYLDRHPGYIKLPVKLEEGSGYMFLKSEWSVFSTTIYLAWESDDEIYSLKSLIGREEASLVFLELDKMIREVLNI